MMPDEMEAEKNRKLLVSQADTIEILKRNVKELQQSLQNAYADIARLAEDRTNAETQIDMMQTYDDISKATEEV